MGPSAQLGPAVELVEQVEWTMAVPDCAYTHIIYLLPFIYLLIALISVFHLLAGFVYIAQFALVLLLALGDHWKMLITCDKAGKYMHH